MSGGVAFLSLDLCGFVAGTFEVECRAFLSFGLVIALLMHCRM